MDEQVVEAEETSSSLSPTVLVTKGTNVFSLGLNKECLLMPHTAAIALAMAAVLYTEKVLSVALTGYALWCNSTGLLPACCMTDINKCIYSENIHHLAVNS